MKAFTILAALIAATAAYGRDLGQWENQTPEVREWYRTRVLTPEARKRFPFAGCCDHSDVFRTRFSVNQKNGEDEWSYEDSPGHFRRVPPDIIHWNEHAPDNQPTLFIWNGQETCFFPPEGGV